MVKYIPLLALIFSLSTLSACGSQVEITTQIPVTETSIPLPQRGLASIEVVEIHQFESSPVRVNVIARGHLPDECATIDQINQNRMDSNFKVTIESIYYDDESCTSDPVPFEEMVELDIVGLSAGIYVVDVNGLQGTFKLRTDNIPDQENGVIGGQVWVDECALGQGQVDNSSPPASCIDVGEGKLEANGLVDISELGLGGVLLNLGSGSCPSTGLAATISDSNGMYLFSGLKGGTYCVSIDNLEAENSTIMPTGDWTYPNRSGEAAVTVSVKPGESNLQIYFGWQFESAVITQPTPSECTDKAIFREDVSIPDNTIITAGEPFSKTWKLQNIGSCTWDEDYNLVFVNGDQLDAPDSIPVTTTVEPGDEVDFSIPLVAPTEAGVYRAEWKILNPDGFLFGIGPGSDRAFWVQISVED